MTGIELGTSCDTAMYLNRSATLTIWMHPMLEQSHDLALAMLRKPDYYINRDIMFMPSLNERIQSSYLAHFRKGLKQSRGFIVAIEILLP